MTAPPPGGPSRGARRGRRPGDARTREAILDAARRTFSRHGFTGTTVRVVAAEAGVDPALVFHYFATKADLFAAAARMPPVVAGIADRLAGLRPDQLGEAILRTLVELWSEPDALAAWVSLVRAAMGDERAAAMLREFLTDVILAPLATALDVPDADRRLALVASQVVGLGVARHVLAVEPLASAPGDDLVEAVAPTIQRYLTGDLGGPGRSGRHRRAGPDAPAG